MSVVDPKFVDGFRDALSAFVGGLALLGISGWIAKRRARARMAQKSEDRLDKHAVEIRHTQKEANIEPFYPGDPL